MISFRCTHGTQSVLPTHEVSYQILSNLILQHLYSYSYNTTYKDNRKRTRDVTVHISKQSFIARSSMVIAYSFLPDIEYCGDSRYVDR
jgi:hypothetical protein